MRTKGCVRAGPRPGSLGLAVLGLAVLLLPMPAGAMSQPVCNGRFAILSSTGTNSFGIPGTEYEIAVGIGAGTITDPDGPGPMVGQLEVRRFRYNLDCALLGSVDQCTDEGDVIGFVSTASIPDPNDGNALKAVVGSLACQDALGTPVQWSASMSGANQVVFEPNEPLVFGENTLVTECQVRFKVVVLNAPGSDDGSPNTIQQAGGASAQTPDWVCNNTAMSAAALGSNAIELCEVCGPDSLCASFACDPDDPRLRAAGGGLCEPDVFFPATTLCRASAGVCDPAEFCTGADADCPADAKLPASAVCRAAAGACDADEFCDGVGDLCPGDRAQPVNTICRAAAGPCDEPELCDGAAPDCPPDRKRTTLCRAATSSCDIAEFCDGVADACPADEFLPAGAVCRPAGNICDLVELCPGNSAFCPADALIPRCGC